MWSDAHTHLHQHLPYANYLKQSDSRVIVNSQSPVEWQWNQKHLKDAKRVTLSYGVHPWDSVLGLTTEDQSYLAKTPVIGEIGLDQEWTDVPLETQRTVFEQQLAIASSRQCPVVLHTKAAEAEVLDCIQQHPGRYLVHWYDCADYQDDFIALGCWFSIGPDVVTQPDVQALAARIPADKLLLETDGLPAVDWSYGQKREGYPPPDNWPKVLHQSAETVAQLRGTTVDTILALAEQNLETFLTP